MLLGEGGDPDVVFRNGRASSRQRRANLSVLIRRRQTGRKHYDGSEKIRDLGQSLDLIRGEISAAIKFPQRGLRQIQRGAGLDLLPDGVVLPEVSDDDGRVQEYVTSG